MSKGKFEAQDEQAMNLANRVHKQERSSEDQGIDPCKNPHPCTGETWSAAESRRRILWTVLQVACCILVAVLLVAALLDPAVVVHLVNAGVLACGIVAAVKIDRFLRR